jgi:hypothetical protein
MARKLIVRLITAYLRGRTEMLGALAGALAVALRQ